MGVSPLPPLRWAVLVFDLDRIIGHEQAGSRRALIVSYESFHRSGRATVCPITVARDTPRYPNELRIPVGEASQTRPGIILCHQVRTVSLLRLTGGLASLPARPPYVTDPTIRAGVRRALIRQLGLDLSREYDGAR